MHDTENPLDPDEIGDGNEPTQADEQVETDIEVSPEDRLRQSTREQLATKDWLAVVPVACECYDRIHTIREKQLTLTQKLGKEKQTKTTLGDQLSREQSDLQKFEAIAEVVQNGGTTVDLSYMGSTLYFLLVEARNYSEDQPAPADTILEKARAQREHAAEASQTTTTLSQSEIAFLHDQIPTYRKKFEEKIADLASKVDAPSALIVEYEAELEKLSEEINEQNIILRTALDVLDEREISEGAPDYANETADPEQLFQSYMARIQWRYDRFQKMGYPGTWPGNKIIGDTWALFVKLGEDYKLLNPQSVHSQIKAHTLLTYRVPHPITAIYTESLSPMHRRFVVKAEIHNGVIQDNTYDQLAERAAQIQGKAPELRYAVR